MKTTKKSWVALAAAGLLLASGGAVQAVSIDWVTVGDPGNAADTRYASPGYGAVGYSYRIGKYEVTNAQYRGFLNAVASVGDANGLYSTAMGSNWGGIGRSGSGTAGSPWTYFAKDNNPYYDSLPVNYVSWYDALRFANWLHNGQPAGGQNGGTTENGAYDMSLGTSVVRKPGALFFLASEDEWYKAAYYKGGGPSAGYWDYPTRSNAAPTAQAPPGTDMINGSANYNFAVGPYSTPVGSYTAMPSASPCGTFDQGGNVWEWNEAGSGPWRGLRGGSSHDGASILAASFGTSYDASNEAEYIGFRLAGTLESTAVPEPATMGLLSIAIAALLRRRKSRGA